MTISSSPSRPLSCSPASGPTWSSPGCVATTPGGARHPRLAARGLLPARRDRRHDRGQCRLHRHHGFGPRACPTRRAAVVADEEADPEGRALVRAASRQLMAASKGASLSRSSVATDAGYGQMAASTRSSDRSRAGAWSSEPSVTSPAEHYAVQREAALAAMGLVVSRAGSAAECCKKRWEKCAGSGGHGRSSPPPGPGPTRSRWRHGPGPQLAGAARRAPRRAGRMRDQPLLTPTADGPAGVGIRLEYPAGTLAIWIELDSGRVLTTEDRTLLSWSAAISARRCTARTRPISNARRPWPCSARFWGRPGCPRGSPSATNPPCVRSEVGGDWYDIVDLPDGRSVSWSAIASGTTSARPR